MTPERREVAERIANRVPHAGQIVLGCLIATIPYALLVGVFVLVWWMAGAVLSITLGQLVLWALIFAAGYAFGKQ